MDNNDDQHGNPLINNLPDDCLRKIFSYLEIPDKLNVEKVCKRWLSVSKLGWPEIDRQDHWIFFSDFSMRQLQVILCRCGRFLTKADFCASPLCLRLLKLITKHCYNLEFCKIHVYRKASQVHQSIVVDTLSILFNRLQKLKKLKVYFSDSGRIDDQFFKNINRNSLQFFQMKADNRDLPHLTINLSEFVNLRTLRLEKLAIDDESLPGFGHMSNLNELIIDIPNMPLKYIDDIKNLKKLKILDINGINSRGEESQIRDHHVSTIVKNCVHLEVLRFSYLWNLSDVCFDDIAELQNLRELQILGLQRITDRSIGKMLQLETLGCYGCVHISNAGLIKLIKESTHLKTLGFIVIVNERTFLHDVNEAMPHRKINTELELFFRSCPFPEDLSPLLILNPGAL